MHYLRIADIIEDSIVDGPGLRLTVFVQGCYRNCPGCHNPQTHDPMGGEDTTAEDVLNRFKANPLLQGITFSGGEPFLQPRPLLWLARKIHKTGKSVISYSGYTLEELLKQGRKSRDILLLLGELDALIDGPFLQERRSLDLLYRGSSNQRYIKREEIAEHLKQETEPHE